MSAKPSLPALWATDSTYTRPDLSGAPNKVVPSSGRIAQGYEPDEEPTAEVWNHRLNLVGAWTEYLDDGELEGDHSIDGALEVTGDLDVGGALTIGALTVTGDASVGDDLTVTDDAAIGGDLAVTGLTTASAGLLASAGPVSLRGVIAPSALSTGSTHDYSPTGLASAIALRLDGASGAALTGIAGGASGRTLIVVNIGTNSIAFNHNDAGSATANRFLLPNNANVTVRTGGTALLWWDFGEIDGTKRGWRMIGGAP